MVFLSPTLRQRWIRQYPWLYTHGGLILAFCLALTLSLADRHSHKQPAYAAPRLMVLEVLRPLHAVFASLAAEGQAAAEGFKAHWRVVEENQRLALKVASLERQHRQWQLTMAENLALRQQLKLPSASSAPLPDGEVMPVIAALQGSGGEELLLKPLAHAAVGGMVLSEGMLVGRVHSSNDGLARVIHVVHGQSRLAVRGLESGAEAIVRGNPLQGTLDVLHLPSNARFAHGETVVTSPSGGVLWPGVPVGVVEKSGDTVLVVPFAARVPVFVRVVPPPV